MSGFFRSVSSGGRAEAALRWGLLYGRGSWFPLMAGLLGSSLFLCSTDPSRERGRAPLSFSQWFLKRSGRLFFFSDGMPASTVASRSAPWNVWGLNFVSPLLLFSIRPSPAQCEEAKPPCSPPPSGNLPVAVWGDIQKVKQEINSFCSKKNIPMEHRPEFMERGDFEVVKFRVRPDCSLFDMAVAMLSRIGEGEGEGSEASGAVGGEGGVRVRMMKAHRGEDTVQLQVKFGPPPPSPCSSAASSERTRKGKGKGKGENEKTEGSSTAIQVNREEDTEGSLDIFLSARADRERDSESSEAGPGPQRPSDFREALRSSSSSTAFESKPLVEYSKRKGRMTSHDLDAIKQGLIWGNRQAPLVGLPRDPVVSQRGERSFHQRGGSRDRDDSSSRFAGQPLNGPDGAPMEGHRQAARERGGRHRGQQLQGGGGRDAVAAQLKDKLLGMGVQAFLPEDEKEKREWDSLAGYTDVKQRIEESVLFGLQHPELFRKITEGTRGISNANQARVVLFEGPPGTGKTSSARVIASQVGVPLLYVPLESVVSKWYGASEKNMSEVFDSSRELSRLYGSSVVFIDEIDVLASSRDDPQQHEASRRLLSVLLRKLDGFDTEKDRTLLICASNRKQDLDEAFRSRVDVAIFFGLPDGEARKAIFKQYARHLEEKELEDLSSRAGGLSGRNIKNLCQDAERRWASKLIRDSRDLREKEKSRQGQEEGEKEQKEKTQKEAERRTMAAERDGSDAQVAGPDSDSDSGSKKKKINGGAAMESDSQRANRETERKKTEKEREDTGGGISGFSLPPFSVYSAALDEKLDSDR